MADQRVQLTLSARDQGIDATLGTLVRAVDRTEAAFDDAQAAASGFAASTDRVADAGRAVAASIDKTTAATRTGRDERGRFARATDAAADAEQRGAQAATAHAAALTASAPAARAAAAGLRETAAALDEVATGNAAVELLKSLGIQAQATGKTTADGMALVTVAAEQLEQATALLSKAQINGAPLRAAATTAEQLAAAAADVKRETDRTTDTEAKRARGLRRLTVDEVRAREEVRAHNAALQAQVRAERDAAAATEGDARAERDAAAATQAHTRATVESSRATRTHADVSRTAATSYNALGASLGQIVALVGAYRVAGFVRGALEQADAVGKLQQKIGGATEALSVFQFAATTADVSPDALSGGLQRFAKFLGEVAQKTPDAVGALRAIGISAKDLQGLSTDQAFLRIANALAQYTDGAEKAAVAQAIFGRSGAELLPLLNDLAGNGFDKARVAAERAGQVFSKDATDAAQRANDALTSLQNSAKGVAGTFAASIAPSVEAAATAVAKFLDAIPTEGKVFLAALTGIGVAALAGAVAVITLTSAVAGLTAAAAGLGLALSATGVGAVIIGVAAITAGVLALADARRREQAEAVRTLENRGREVSQARSLTEAYRAEAKAIESGTLKGKDLEDAKKRLKSITEELKKLSPEYANALREEGRAADEVTAALDKLIRKEAERAEREVFIAEMNLLAAERELAKERGRLATSSEASEVARNARLRAREAEVTRAQERLAAAKRGLDLASGAATPAADNRPNPGDLGGGTDGAADRRAAAEARLAAARAANERELAQTRDRIKSEEQANQLGYDAEEKSLREFFARRIALVQQATLAEVETLKKEHARLAAEPIATDGETADAVAAARIKRAQELADLQQRIQTREAEGERQVQALRAEGDTARLANAAQIEQYEARIRAARGETLQNALAAIDREAEAFREKLIRDGIGEEERELRVTVFVDTEQARARFDDLNTQAQRVLADIENARTRVQQDVTLGIRSEVEGQRLIAEMERGRLPTLQQIVAQMRAFAVAAGPEAVQAVDALAVRIDGMGVTVDAAAMKARQLGDSFRSAATSDLTTFFSDTITQVDSLGEAVGSLASSVVRSIQRIVSELLAAQLVGGLTKLLGLGGGLPSIPNVSIPSYEIPGLPFAGGGYAAGYIRGPGTATSDSIPARLSHGEYVMRASAVDRYGVAFFDALNRGLPTRRHLGGVPGYANGGPVTLTPRADSGATLGGDITVRPDEGAVVAAASMWIRSRGGREELLRVLIEEAPRLQGVFAARGGR